MQSQAQGLRDQFYADLRKDYARRYKTFDAPSMEVLYELLQIMTMIDLRCQNRMHAKGLTRAGLNVLSILRKQGTAGCPLHIISGLLLVSRANVTGLIDSLARKGLVRREDHATDRRITLATITKKGETLLDTYLPEHYTHLCATVSGLNAREKTTLVELLSKLRKTSLRDVSLSS